MFTHIIVDMVLREVTTAKGDTVVFCQIEANAPLDCDGKETKLWYSWGRIIEPGRPFAFDCGPLCLILVSNCCGDIGVFVVAHINPEDPTFQALVYEGDELIVAKCSDTMPDKSADFDFAWFNKSQRLRIETIPDFETHERFRDLARTRQNKDEDGSGRERKGSTES